MAMRTFFHFEKTKISFNLYDILYMTRYYFRIWGNCPNN